MKARITLFTVALLTALAYAQPAGPYWDMLAPAGVQLEYISSGRAMSGGNGFVLCHPRIGVTAYHVATDTAGKPLTTMYASQYGGRKYSVRVVYHDDKTDVALFEPPPGAGCVSLGRSLALGEKLRFFGALGAFTQDPYIGRAIIVWSGFFYSQQGELTSCCRDYRNLAPQLGERWNYIAQTNLASPRGASGSAIVNEGLEVVGLLVGGFSLVDTLIVPLPSLEAALARWQSIAGGI